MLKTLIVFPFLLVTIFILISLGFTNRSGNKKTGANQGFALVELFTSEGCSSCPPADQAVASVAGEYKTGVYILCFHVDYWNNLGWKDAFSNASYTSRQRQYASVFRLNSVYTPQIVVNGEEEFVGSDEKRLNKVIGSELGKGSIPVAQLDIKINDEKTITVSYKVANPGTGILNIALVQLHAVTNVRAGENGGKTLSHIDIVRDFKTVTNNNGTVILTIPAGLKAKDFKIIAYSQEKEKLRITGAMEKLL